MEIAVPYNEGGVPIIILWNRAEGFFFQKSPPSPRETLHHWSFLFPHWSQTTKKNVFKKNGQKNGPPPFSSSKSWLIFSDAGETFPGLLHFNVQLCGMFCGCLAKFDPSRKVDVDQLSNPYPRYSMYGIITFKQSWSQCFFIQNLHQLT